MSEAREEVRLGRQIPVEKTEEIIREALNQRGATIKNTEVDRNRIRIIAETDASLLSWGERIYIDIRPEMVEIMSEADQLIDWGKTQEHVNEIVDWLSNSQLDIQRDIEFA